MDVLTRSGYRMQVRFVLMFAAAIVAFAVAWPAEAANRYWVGAKNGGLNASSWEALSNWSTKPRGASGTGGATVPGEGDIAIFSHSGNTVRLQSVRTVHGILLANNWTGTVMVGTGILNVHSAGIRVGSGTFLGPNTNGQVNITATGSIGFSQTGGTVSNIVGNLNNSGTLVIVSNWTSQSVVRFTATGTIMLSPNQFTPLTFGRNRLSLSIRRLVVNGGTSGRVYSTGSGVTLSGSLTVNTGTLDTTYNVVVQHVRVHSGFTLASAAAAIFRTSTGMTLSGNLTIGANGIFTQTGGLFLVQSNNPQTLTVNKAIRVFNNFRVNNTGGSSRNIVTVVGSGLNASGTVVVQAGILDLNSRSQALTASGLVLDGSATLKAGGDITLTGSLTIGASSTMTHTGGALILSGSSIQNVAINKANQRFNRLTVFNRGLNRTLSNVLVSGNAFSLSGALTVSGGTLDLRTNTIAIAVKGNITVQNSALAQLLTNANITTSGSVIKKGSGVFAMSGGTLKLNGTSQALSGAMIISTLYKVASSTDTLQFYPTVTYTVNGDSTIAGANATSKLTASSQRAGAAWTLTGPRNAYSYLKLSDSSSVGSVNKLCMDCTDSGNNINWTFDATPSTSTTATTTSGGGGGGGGSSGRRGDAGAAAPRNDATTTITAPSTTVTPSAPKKSAIERRIDSLKRRIGATKNKTLKARLEKAIKSLEKQVAKKKKK